MRMWFILVIGFWLSEGVDSAYDSFMDYYSNKREIKLLKNLFDQYSEDKARKSESHLLFQTLVDMSSKTIFGSMHYSKIIVWFSHVIQKPDWAILVFFSTFASMSCKSMSPWDYAYFVICMQFLFMLGYDFPKLSV